MKNFIQTFSGKAFDLIDPQPDMICIEDIAHALSNICRFTGHTKKHWSVAHHSVFVVGILLFADAGNGDADALDKRVVRQALLHDATEAYVGDMASPLKELCPDYRAIEDRVWAAIAAKYDVPEDIDPRVKHADIVALLSERRDLMRKSEREWSPYFDQFKALSHPYINPLQIIKSSNIARVFKTEAMDLGVKE
jgi:5'-deoxynucleotidase YfbR-like HD superfamily hydrolase